MSERERGDLRLSVEVSGGVWESNPSDFSLANGTGLPAAQRELAGWYDYSHVARCMDNALLVYIIREAVELEISGVCESAPNISMYDRSFCIIQAVENGCAVIQYSPSTHQLSFFPISTL